jgi:hypothetical protein
MSSPDRQTPPDEDEKPARRPESKIDWLSFLFPAVLAVLAMMLLWYSLMVLGGFYR